PIERPERFLVQPRPALLIGFPHDFAKALARVLERHHEQIRPTVLTVRLTRRRPFAEVDLRLFPGQCVEHVKALGLTCLEPGDETFDRVVGVRKSMSLDQVLIDAHGVAAEAERPPDPPAVDLARRGGGPQRPSRWPGWGILEQNSSFF